MKLVQTECMTWFALIWFIGGYGWKKIKTSLQYEFDPYISKTRNMAQFYPKSVI